jgi:hypothetical protein
MVSILVCCGVVSRSAATTRGEYHHRAESIEVGTAAMRSTGSTTSRITVTLTPGRSLDVGDGAAITRSPN